MRTFFQKIRRNIYDPVYYRDLMMRPVSYSFKYFIFLVFLASVTLTMYTSYFVASFFNQTVPEVLEELRSSYPDKLVIFLKDGQISTNLDEPYGFLLPDKWRNAEGGAKNFVVINTRREPTLDNLKKFSTLILVGKDSFAYLTDNQADGMRVQSLRDIPDMQVDKNDINRLFDTVLKYRFLVIFFVLCILVLGFFLILFLGYLSYLLIGSLLILLALRARSIEAGYLQAYRIGFHAITPAVLYDLITRVIPVLHIPFYFSIILGLTVYLNFRTTLQKDISDTQVS